MSAGNRFQNRISISGLTRFGSYAPRRFQLAQLVPNGALTAVALFRISSNHISVPFIIFKDQRGGSLTKTRSEC